MHSLQLQLQLPSCFSCCHYSRGDSFGLSPTFQPHLKQHNLPWGFLQAQGSAVLTNTSLASAGLCTQTHTHDTSLGDPCQGLTSTQASPLALLWELLPPALSQQVENVRHSPWQRDAQQEQPAMSHQASVPRQGPLEGALPHFTTAGAKTPAFPMPSSTLFAREFFNEDFQCVLYIWLRRVKQIILPLCLVFHG